MWNLQGYFWYILFNLQLEQLQGWNQPAPRASASRCDLCNRRCRLHTINAKVSDDDLADVKCISCCWIPAAEFVSPVKGLECMALEENAASPRGYGSRFGCHWQIFGNLQYSEQVLEEVKNLQFPVYTACQEPIACCSNWKLWKNSRNLSPAPKVNPLVYPNIRWA